MVSMDEEEHQERALSTLFIESRCMHLALCHCGMSADRRSFSRAKKYPGSYGNRGKRACPTIDDRVDSRFNGNLRATSGHSPQEESVKPLDSEFGVTKAVQLPIDK